MDDRSMRGTRMIGAALVALFAGSVLADIPLELVNPGFESVKDGRAVGWHYGPNFKAVRDGHNGSGGLVWTFTEGLDDVESKERRAWQDVGPIKEGKHYVVSMNVRPKGVEVVKLTPSRRQGIALGLEFLDKNGKNLKGMRARPLPCGTADWTKVELISKAAPAGAVKARVLIYSHQCTAGTASIDQVYIAEQERLPVEAVYSSAYRDEATEGVVKFAALLNYELGTKPEDHVAEFVYKSASGGEKRVRATEINRHGAIAYIDVGDFAFGAGKVACELRKDGVVLGRNEMTFSHPKTPVKRRVAIDLHGRIIIDGKPVFLIGMGLERPVADEWLKLYAEGEFNFVQANFQSREELDLVHKYGLYALVSANKDFVSADHGLESTRKIVEMAKDHPATVMYAINDEQPVVSEPWIRARKELIWRLDPDHPTRGTQDHAIDAREHISGADLVSCDPYPIGRNGDEQDTVVVMRMIRETMERNLAIKPTFHIPQFFSWTWLSRSVTRLNRSPSPAEMANMSWQMIALGACGLSGYSFGQIFKDNRNKRRPYERTEFYWPVIKAVVHDIRRYEDVILSIEPAPKILEGNADPFVARTWRKDGDVYLLVASGLNRITHATIRLSEKVGKVKDWDFCEKPTVKGDTVTFDFPPCGFGMVRLGK